LRAVNEALELIDFLAPLICRRALELLVAAKATREPRVGITSVDVREQRRRSVSWAQCQVLKTQRMRVRFTYMGAS